MSSGRAARYRQPAMAVETLATDVLSIAPTQPAPIRFGRGWSVTLIFLDVAMLALANAAAAYVVQRITGGALDPPRVGTTAAICIVSWILLFYRFGLYRRSFAFSIRDELYCTVTALAAGALPLLAAFTIVPAISSSRIVVLLTIAFAFVTLGTTRVIARQARELSTAHQRRVAVVGTQARVASALEQLDGSGSEILAIEVEDLEGSFDGVDSLSFDELDRVPWLAQVRGWGCDVLCMTEMVPPRVLPALLRLAAFGHFTVAFAPPRFCAQAYDLKLETNGHQALIVPRQLYACTHGPRVMKRAIDLVIAAAILLVASPIMMGTALAILIEDGRPIFFRQERVGLFGRRFAMLKFRSMSVDAEAKSGPIWSPVGDKRVTRVGRFIRRTSIDELPQLINVLRGDMSIVGPRPERPLYVETFQRRLPRYDERHLVRPGITGWAQINMPRKLEVSQVGEKLSHDLWYIEHWGLFMDLSIVCKTAFEFLFHRA